MNLYKNREGEKTMFLHIGKDFVIPIRDIIAIVDVKSTTDSIINKEFIETATEEGFIVDIVDSPKSYVITEKTDSKKDFKRGKTRTCIYGSAISTSALVGRMNLEEL